MIKRISVFCGSGHGSDPVYTDAARGLGSLLVDKNIGLVFGGGNIGLMGEIAGTVIKGGGEAIGVIPRALAAREIAHTGLTDLHLVNTMHERKAMIAEIADAFIALPGGFGTMDEIFEALTWAQLGIHEKPCAFLNVCGYFDHLFRFIDHAVSQEFVQDQNKSLFLTDDNAENLLKKIEDFKPVRVDKARWALNKQSHQE